jgi:hypothetical protein
MNDVESENRFVIIYSPKMSENPTPDTGYREDYFRVWNPVTNDFDERMPGAFTNTPVSEDSDLVSRYGYYVPSFGVAFSRQNNHIFKNINLDMSTPLVTSASINALSRISEMGGAYPHKVAFMGQDLYPVYSNYSYICEIEMMGDAQIQPLMYFQLMNVPMWSGVYMIFNVTHTISAGTMTTRFKGMKLSRYPVPYSSSWFVFNPDASTYDPYETEEENGDSYGNYGNINSDFSNNDSTKLKLVLNRTELTPKYTMGQLYIDGVYFCDVVEDCVRNVSSGNCVKKIDKETAIPYGEYQVSIKVPSNKFDGKEYYKKICGEYHVPMVMNVPCFNGIRIHKGATAKDSWGCLLVGKKSANAGRIENTDEIFAKLFPILKKAEIDDKKKIILKIVNSNDYNQYAKGVDKDATASNLNGASLQNISYVRNRLKSEFGITDIQFCGIAGNFVQESSFYPTAEEYRGKPNKGGKGLAQWTADRRVAAEEWLGMPIIKAPLSRQVDYLIYELKNTEKSTIPAVKRTNSVSDAVMAFEKNFERAGKPAYENRIKYGNLVKKYIESGQIS